MSLDNHSREDLYLGLITWDVPAIRRSKDEDAIAFVETIQLRPSTGSDNFTESSGNRIPALRRALAGLRAEFSGDVEGARSHYKKLARLPGARGLLGHLLIAWMGDATRDDFSRVETRLERLVSHVGNDVIARSHLKLTGWALDQGWPDSARHHYRLAQEYAGAELTNKLGEIGHWFGERQTISLGRSFSDLIRFPWILDFVNTASRNSLEDRVKESFKNPWSRTWKFGNTSAEGFQIQSAAMQASWAGALWLMPTIQRQHAALILENSREPADVARAIALWVRGGGGSVSQLVLALEGYLTAESVSDVIISRLHSGRSVISGQSWLDLCHALWSELPDAAVEDFVAHYPGPRVELRPHTEGAVELALFAKLIARISAGPQKLASLSDEQLALVLRMMPPERVDVVPADALYRGLISALADEREEWSATGWATLVQAWSYLAKPHRDNLREELLQRIPAWQIAVAASIASDLVPSPVLEDQLSSEIEAVSRDIDNAHRGIFVGSPTQPSSNIAWLSYRLGEVRQEAESALVGLANDHQVQASERQAALAALTMLARKGMLVAANVASAFHDVQAHALAFTGDDTSADQRYEDLQRIGLQLSFGQSDIFDGKLLANSRDSSTRVRHLAVSTIQYLSLQGTVSPALDGALLGALYDPNPRVQATVVPATWRGEFASAVIGEAARLRLVELWPTAPLELRLAIAREVALAKFSAHDQLNSLVAQCASDRSALVRAAARGDASLLPDGYPARNRGNRS